MGLTAFLPTGAPQILPFIGVPGAATVGHALVWSETPQGFTLAPPAVGPDQFSGVLPVAKGGWGTSTGSFTSPGAITLVAGGTNQGITLSPSGNGSVVTASPVQSKSIAINSPPVNFVSPAFPLAIQGTSTTCIQMIAPGAALGYPAFGIITTADSFNRVAFGLNNGVPFLGFGSGSADRDIFLLRSATGSLTLSGNVSGSGEATILVTGSTQSTSTTTGAIRTNGGLGVVKNAIIGGNLKVSGSAINFASLPTANTGLTVGDLWRDGENVKVKL